MTTFCTPQGFTFNRTEKIFDNVHSPHRLPYSERSRDVALELAVNLDSIRKGLKMYLPLAADKDKQKENTGVGVDSNLRPRFRYLTLIPTHTGHIVNFL